MRRFHRIFRLKPLLTVLVVAPTLLSAQTKSVLWLGNSYTAVNNLPDLVYQLALSGGDTLTYDSNTPGGYTLQMHSQDANTLQKINAQDWDYVVIQCQSQEPSLDTPYVVANVFPYARFLDSLIHVNDSCTQTCFYMTWGRKNGDASNCVAYPPVCTYQGMQDQLRNRYLQMGYDNGAMVAPCGETWRDVIATNPSFDLYMADESHPSLYGSYLNACVFYASIYRRSPLGLPYYGGLTQSEATFLQQMAATTVLDSMSVWNTEVYYGDATFFSNVNGLTYVFAGDPNAGSHQWDFGNGFVNGNANEVYTFPSAGTYTVTHVVMNSCGRSDTSSQTFVAGPQSLVWNCIPKNVMHVYPVPSSEFVHITNPTNAEKPCTVQLFDAKGNLVRQYQDKGATLTMDTSELSDGVFTVTILQNGISYSQPFTVCH